MRFSWLEEAHLARVGEPELATSGHTMQATKSILKLHAVTAKMERWVHCRFAIFSLKKLVLISSRLWSGVLKTVEHTCVGV